MNVRACLAVCVYGDHVRIEPAQQNRKYIFTADLMKWWMNNMKKENVIA